MREGLGTSSGGVFGTGSTGSTENELSYDRVGDYIFGDIIFDKIIYSDEIEEYYNLYIETLYQ